MTCSRCSGLMLEELMLDIEGGFGEMWTKSRRCVNCGHIHDAVMERNGPAHTKKSLVYASSEPDYQEDLGVESYYQKAA